MNGDFIHRHCKSKSYAFATQFLFHSVIILIGWFRKRWGIPKRKVMFNTAKMRSSEHGICLLLLCLLLGYMIFVLLFRIVYVVWCKHKKKKKQYYSVRWRHGEWRKKGGSTDKRYWYNYYSNSNTTNISMNKDIQFCESISKIINFLNFLWVSLPHLHRFYKTHEKRKMNRQPFRWQLISHWDNKTTLWQRERYLKPRCENISSFAHAEK